MLKNQKGFSLVELMIVVAIIGILAAIAIPNFQKFQEKARQAEAKSSLSGIFTAEAAFFAEYNTYSARFDSIGYSATGNVTYDAGFAADLGAPPAAAPQGTATCIASCPGAAPGAIPACAAGFGAGWACATPTGTGAIAAAAAVAVGGLTYIAEARSRINPGAAAVDDVWRITQLQALTNFASGL